MKKAGFFTFQLSREGIEARLGEMEKKLDRLHSMYEAFFMGMERIPPNTLRHEMNRLMLEMQQAAISNSALRFRFQALSQKWVLQITYWNRTMREIEAGTFHRDMARTQRHLAERGGAITEEEAVALGIPKSRVKAFVTRQQRQIAKKELADSMKTEPAEKSNPVPTRSGPPPIPASARPSPAPVEKPPASLPGLSDKEFESAYQHYLSAHRELGIEAQAVPMEKMRSRLHRQLPKILDEQRCEKVRLEIAVEDGKVRMRAWPAADRG